MHLRADPVKVRCCRLSPVMQPVNGRSRPAEAIPALIQVLEDEDEYVRSSAVFALGEIGPQPGVVPALLEALGDEDGFVRGTAAEALGKIGPEEGVVSALMQAVGDEDAYVRQTAVLALKRIGSGAAAAVPALIQALQDKSDRVRGYAAEALEAITGQQFGQDAARWQQWWTEQQP